MEVDLENQTVESFRFEIDPFKKHCLMNGLDDIGLTLEKEALISGFEKQDSDKRPWLYG
jgi:3-isopropylmalate/(R)-2-methylmalate dehydratase small subunit